MAVVINQSNSEIYFGHLKMADAKEAYPGDVVVADDSAGTCAPPVDTAADGADLYLVCNYDPYADTDLTNSKDYKVVAGKYVRLKALQIGDVFTTDRFIGDFATIAVDDVFAVNGAAASGTQGKWIAVGARTPVLKAKVIEKTTIYGQNALKFRVISA